MSVLVVPDPGVIVLIGAAGSGKSTLAARHFAPGEVLSSDAFRAAIAGDERDQRASGAAFRAIARELDRRLAAGRLTVVDATNVRAADRRPWLAAAARHGVPAVAIVLGLPPATVARQDAGRARVVGAEVIERHLAALRRSLAPGVLVAEGFTIVAILASQRAVAGLRIERVPRA
ncbi:MAG: AAA family ATPase [Candidatus Limnocylindrales bacterium]